MARDDLAAVRFGEGCGNHADGQCRTDALQQSRNDEFFEPVRPQQRERPGEHAKHPHQHGRTTPVAFGNAAEEQQHRHERSDVERKRETDVAGRESPLLPVRDEECARGRRVRRQDDEGCGYG